MHVCQYFALDQDHAFGATLPHLSHSGLHYGVGLECENWIPFG